MNFTFKKNTVRAATFVAIVVFVIVIATIVTLSAHGTFTKIASTEIEKVEHTHS